MAEGSVANLRSRVLRSNTASKDIENDRTKSKKRAKPIEEAPFEKVVDDKVCVSVQDVVNSKAPSEAPRGNLLKLLDQHIIKKKARTSKKSSQKKTVKQFRRPIRERPPISPSEIDHTFAPRPQDVDYDQYTDEQLRGLVGDVGLDADGLPRTELVKTCKTYQDLIVLPPVLPSFTFRKSRHAPLEGRSTPDETTDSGKRNVPIAVLADSTSGPDSLPLTSSPPDTQPSDTRDIVQNQDSTLECDDVPPNFTRRDSDAGDRDREMLQDDVTTGPTEGRPTIGSRDDKALEEIPLPSLEHRRLSYPRPHPTVLTSNQNSATSKGKGRSRVEDDPDDPDWDLSFHAQESDLEDLNLLAGELDSDIDDPAHLPYQGSSKARFQAQQETRKSNSSRKGAKKHSRTAASPKSMSQSEQRNQGDGQSRESMLKMIYELQDALNKSNQRLDKLTEEVKILNQVTQKNIDEEQVLAGKKKTRGGRIALSVRFHIDTLLGLEENSLSLPAPATLAEKESWMSDLEIGLVNFDLDTSDETMEPPNLNSTDYSGPRHKDSTPQQISIMQQMMLAVGVSSFRPDFSEAATSKDNKWLWDLGFKIFIKLVECGEYVGISLDAPNFSSIKKAFETRVQSLMKRFREQSWDEARKKKATDAVRRNARVRYLKKSREKIVLSNQALWPLSVMVQKCCSDDETDHEDCQDEIAQHVSSPVHIRKLRWRSADLQNVFTRLDSYKARIDAITPNRRCSQGSTSTPTGRPSRLRIRCDNARISDADAPIGLSLDCYSQEWLQTLSRLERSQLEMKPQRVLSQLIPILNGL